MAFVGGWYVDMCLFPYFTTKLAVAPTTPPLSLEVKMSHYKVNEGLLTTHCRLLNHLSETHATDDIIAKTDRKAAQCRKPSNMSPILFFNELWLKAIRCPQP